MISIKSNSSIEKMRNAGMLLSEVVCEMPRYLIPGVSTLDLERHIEAELKKRELISQAKGYMGYRHVSCISVNDEVIHGVPSADKLLKKGDLVKIDICASWNGYCADMARSFFVGDAPNAEVEKFAKAARIALNKGIEMAMPGNVLSDISAAIQQSVESHGYGVVRNFAGHGIGKKMHEAPEILNYGKPGKGPVLKSGMTFAIEPMITMGHWDVFVEGDGWTVRTVDGSLAAHEEDTVLITDEGPKILTNWIV